MRVRIFGENLEISSEKLLRVFEKRENTEKLMNMLEKLEKKGKKVVKNLSKRIRVDFLLFTLIHLI